MALDNKFIVLNKYEDFSRAYMNNCTINSDDILIQDDFGVSACYLSRKIDCLNDGMRWMRISINSSDIFVNIIAFATDIDIESVDYEELYTYGYGADEIINILKRDFETIEIKNNIGLLHKLKGRYLYFLLRFNGKDENVGQIYDIKIEFDIDSFTKYFPAIYRKNMYDDDFFYRLILVYQDIYMDIEDKIDKKYLDYDSKVADKDALMKLINMLNFEECKIFDTDIIRKLIDNYSSIMKLKGSIKGVELLTKLILNKDIKIIEHYEIFDKNLSIEARKELSRTFVDDIFYFTIIVNDADDINDIQREKYILFMDYFVPLKTSYEVIFESDDNLEQIQLDVGRNLPVRL